MSNVILSPNMSLPVPTPSVDPGPDWATNYSACLSILDGHNHSPGSGNPINPAGININADLTMNANNLIAINTLRFTALGASLPGTSPNLGCLYVAGNELYYNDESGNVTKMTNNGSVNSGAGSITGLPSGTASASYNSANQTFIWQSATSTPANLDAGSVIFRNLTANSFGVTVSAPSSLGSNYNLALPTIPSATNFVTLDTGGNFAAVANVDNSSLQFSSNTLAVKAHGVQQGMLALKTTGSTVAAGGVAISASSGTFSTATSGSDQLVTGSSITITTTGRPISLSIVSDQSGNTSYLGQATSGISTTGLAVYLGTAPSGTVVARTQYTFNGTGTYTNQLGCPGFIGLYQASAGTYTFTYAVNTSAGGGVSVNYLVLMAYEI
jgi:hypothetical protein